MTAEQPQHAANPLATAARMLWTDLPALLLHALYFNLCAWPPFVLFSIGYLTPALLAATVTAGPAWGALQTVTGRMIEDEPVSAGQFVQALGRRYGANARLSVVGAVPPALLLALLPRLQQEPVPLSLWMGIGSLLLVCALTTALLLYAFPLLARQPTSVRTALEDAGILASRYLGQTLGLLAMGILGGLAIAYLSLALVLILPTLYALFISANCRLALQKEQARERHVPSSR